MYKTNPASRSCLSFFKQPIRKLLVNIGDSSRMVPACTRAGAMFLSLFIILFSGCTSHKPARTREVILIEYRAFCDSLESLPSIPFHRLPEVIDRWSSLEGELFSRVLADSIHEDENLIIFSTVSVLGNRIQTKVKSSIDDSIHSFSDVASFEFDIAARQYPPSNRFVGEANDFYSLNLCQTAMVDPPGSELEHYMRFLDEVDDIDITDFDDVKELLYQEDLLYRAYLDNMLDHSYRESYGIISQTEYFSDRLADYAVSHPDDSERLLAYMTVRTIRRQLLCARKGLDCILSGEVKTLEQATSSATCFTALLVHFNPLLLSYRTEEQNREVEGICQDVPKAFNALEERGLIVISHPDSLPNRILKDYVDYLIYN